MAVTAYRNPTVTVSSVTMTTPDSGWTSDNTYAQFDAVNDEVVYGTFGNFSIPSISNIIGVEVVVEAKHTGAGVNHGLLVNISYDGSTFKGGKLVDTTTSDVEYTLGSATDTWGFPFYTDSKVNNNTSLQIKLTCSTFSVTTVDLDSVKVRFYYTDDVLRRSKVNITRPRPFGPGNAR